MAKKQVKLGFVPTRRALGRMSLDVARKDKERIETKLKEWNIEYVGLDWLNEDGFLYDTIDASRVAARFKAEGVDAVFVPHCNFGSEGPVGIMAREVGKPLLLWGPQDPTPVGYEDRAQDIQCGLFATSKVLRRVRVPFTYIVNSAVDSPVFKRGFHMFVGAVSAANNFVGARIGQVSVRPPAFWTTMYNESELLERWGIQVVPTTLENLRQAVLKKEEENSEELHETINQFKRISSDFSTVEEKHIKRLAAVKLALVAFTQEQDLDAVAVHCHQPFRDALGVALCFVNAVVTDLMIPVACETDMHGALTSLLMQGAGLNTTPTFFADLTIRHPENRNAELLWHCGNFAPSLALDPDSRNLKLHQGYPVAASWEVKGGDITVARFDGDNGQYSLFMGKAKGTTGPVTNGAYVWVEVDNWPKWEEKLMYGPYIHHCVGVHQQVVPVLYEACKYIPGLEPDPVDPTEEEIRAYWRGEDLEAEPKKVDLDVERQPQPSMA